MAEDHVARKLAAILYADVAGYSRLTGADEEGTHRIVADYLDALSESVVTHGGRVVHYAGDAILADFPSVVTAVHCAVEIQKELAARNAGIPDDRKVQFRIGVNLGDVIVDRDDIYGNGVNVAARLEGLADPGGICVSGSVLEQVQDKVDVGFEDMGAQHVKNIAQPIRVYKVRPTREATNANGPTVNAPMARAGEQQTKQTVRFCTTADGVRIAYAITGNGPPLVKAPNWMHHLDYDWKSPVWGHLLRALSRNHTLLRFDQRCNGLSDWDVPEVTFETMVEDMAAVVDAVGLKRFALLGISAGCYYSIAYAVRHPERVSRLVLYGGCAQGRLRRGSDTDAQMHKMRGEMIMRGWGQNNPAFRQFFTSLFIPGATKEQMDWFNELQRVTVSPENAMRLNDVSGNADVSDLLEKISMPTLVLHSRDDATVPFELGRRMAAMIPNARFVELECKNHLILEGDTAWPRFIDEVNEFLSED